MVIVHNAQNSTYTRLSTNLSSKDNANFPKTHQMGTDSKTMGEESLSYHQFMDMLQVVSLAGICQTVWSGEKLQLNFIHHWIRYSSAELCCSSSLILYKVIKV